YNSSVTHAAESMIQHANMIKKIYFPRLIIPTSSILVAFFDFLMALLVFFILCVWYHQPVSWKMILYIPAGIVVTMLSALGLGSFFSALNLKYRDFRYILPFMLQVLFFSSQVLYSLQAVNPVYLKYLLAINPLNGAIELFRASFTGFVPDMNVILIGSLVSVLLAAAGLFYFRKTEYYFADIA
ncbi:MAG: ABC transporter permease, partial [Chitinophagaceae bacterium]